MQGLLSRLADAAENISIFQGDSENLGNGTLLEMR
jgi:hypothetical protein